MVRGHVAHIRVAHLHDYLASSDTMIVICTFIIISLIYTASAQGDLQALKSNDSSLPSVASSCLSKTLKRLPSISFNVRIDSSLIITIDKDLTLAPRPGWRSCITTVFISLPIRQHSANPWTVRKFVDLLKIFFGNVEWLSGHIGDVFPN